MTRTSRSWSRVASLAVAGIATLSLALAACSGGDEEEPAATVVPTQVATSAAATATASPAPEATAAATNEDEEATDDHDDEDADVHDEEEALRVTAATASISLDGNMDDWAAIEGIEVPLEAIDEQFLEEPTAGEDVTVTLKVATDGTNLYVLVAVPDGYDYDPENRRLSPALGVEWRIDEGATAHMGAEEPDFETSGGMVDIWHWELDCGPGELSGGVFPSGNDPNCNLDDEYATLLDEREDDDAENSLTGSWDHTGRAEGIGADGTFVFEMARPLQTGDPQDAQFTLGETAWLALAYWDGNEGREKDGGWTDAGHVVSAEAGWIEVALAK